jgi:hypothetical protein
MMCFGRRDKDDGGASRSRELDKIIRQDEKRLAKEVKLLLLGRFNMPNSRAATRDISRRISSSTRMA